MTADGPARPDGLIGRDREIGELLRLSAASRMVTLCGAGGIGKTRLLRALTAELNARCPDGASLVSLGKQPGQAAPRLASDLGVQEEPGIPLAATLAAALAGRQLALALDGGDPGECAALCQQFLAAAPGLSIVAAGRRPLRVPGEVIWQVPPLGMPGPGEEDPDTAAGSAAVRLLAARAGGAPADPAFAAAAARICRAAGGVPLAIELAAARIPELGAAATAASLSAAPGLVARTAGEPPGPVPHAAITAAVIAWSHGLLGPDEQVLLRRLAAARGWTVELIEDACADEHLPAMAIAGLLARLADARLVEPEPDPPGRYRLPGAVRDFAAARLAEAGEADALHRRVRDFAARRAEYIIRITTAQVPVSWPVLREVFTSYEANARDIRSLLTECLDRGDAEAGLQVCARLRIFWIATGAQDEGARWLDALLAAAGPDVPGAVRGPALAARAQFALNRGDLPGAQERAGAALEPCRAARDAHHTGVALNVLARAAVQSGRPLDGLRCADEALEVARQADDWWSRSFSLGSRSLALAAAGRMAEAAEAARTGLALCVETNQYWGAAQFRVGLGALARAAGDLAAARDYFLAALPFTREAMPAPEVAVLAASLGRVLLRLGEPGPAREYLGEALRLSLGAGSRALTARGLLSFADLALRESCPDRAVRLAAAATALCEAAGLPPPSPGRTQRYLDAAAGLGAATAARLWAAGLELAPDEAAALALGSAETARPAP
jgi:predicted ATPase